MTQQIIVFIIFLAAVCYVLWLIYKAFRAKSACNTGCGKCNAVDFEKIEKQLKQKGV
jgi:hypothetical protein